MRVARVGPVAVAARRVQKKNPDRALFALLAGFTTHSPNAEVTTLRASDHRFQYS
jgi:hypothetical protein